jgi:hypothetical protein
MSSSSSQNSRGYSTQAGCISADQKRIGDNLDKHIIDADRNFVSLLHLAAQSAGGGASEADIGSDAGCNATNAAIGNLATELNVLKGRQAASAALQVIQFLLFAGYLITLAVNYVVKKCRKHSKKRGEETVELLEQKLQERKSRRRAAAARQSSADK